ncbi:hypothetical protein EMCRGX_G029816 [Ephydatia muelleri]
MVYHYVQDYVHTKDFRRKTKIVTVYLAGVGSGLAAVGAFFLSRRLAFPNPNHALMSVLPTLRANPEVRSIVGSNLKPGLFKTYSYIGGFRPRAQQTMFQVCGEHSSAMVTLQVPPQSKGIPVQCKTLIVDFANGERLVLKGTAESVVFQGYTTLT